VDGVEPVVPVELLDRVVAGVAVATVHLDGEVVGDGTPLGRPGLRDRREHLQKQVRPRPRVVGLGGLLLVDQARAVQPQRQAAFGVGLRRQQHPADIGMLDDRDGGA
jgi:hypothetical protein